MTPPRPWSVTSTVAVAASGLVSTRTARWPTPEAAPTNQKSVPVGWHWVEASPRPDPSTVRSVCVTENPGAKDPVAEPVTESRSPLRPT